MVKKNLVQRFLDLFRSNERNYNQLPNNPLYNLLFGNDITGTASGEVVTVKSGTGISTVFSCINVLSQDIAKLPLNLKKDSDTGSESVKTDIVYRLIHTRPNAYTSSYNFWYRVVWEMLSYGNSFVWIKKSDNYRPSELHHLDHKDVKIEVIDGTAFYKCKDSVIHQDDILHFKMYSFDGIQGVSPIIYLAETFGYKIKQDKYKAKVLGTKPAGLLSFSERLTDVQMEHAREMWQKMTTGKALGETPVLGGGASYTPFMIPPNEGQMIESAKLTREEIAGIYRIPPTMIQDYERATFSNAEQQDLVYLKYSLTPIIKAIELECDYKLFSSRSPLYTKFNVKAMLRGDIKTQAEWYRTLSNIGVLSINDIRKMEDLETVDDGDQRFVQGAMIPIDKIGEFYEGKTEPGERSLGFNIQEIKESLERLDIQNNGV